MFLFLRRARFSALAAALILVPALRAGNIPFGQWQQFSFQSAGVAARGCDPADPSGDFCFPSSGTPSTFLDAPPWTFTVAGNAILTVTDAFTSGDRFEIFNGLNSLGLTSAPFGVADCGDDPAVCAGTAGISAASFLLSAGSYSITVVPTVTSGGSGFLMVSDVPEPGSFLLLAFGGLLLSVIRFGASCKEEEK
jgi:hypothetical protein